MVLGDMLREKMDARFKDLPNYEKYKRKKLFIADSAMYIWQEIKREFLRMYKHFENVGFENIYVFYEFSSQTFLYSIGDNGVRKIIKVESKMENEYEIDYNALSILKMVGHYASLEGFKIELNLSSSPSLLVTI